MTGPGVLKETLGCPFHDDEVAAKAPMHFSEMASTFYQGKFLYPRVSANITCTLALPVQQTQQRCSIGRFGLQLLQPAVKS